MKRLLTAFLLLFPVAACAADYPMTEFSGMVDTVSPDKIADKYSPIDGCLNIWTDEYAMITKCAGTVKYNTTALPGELKAKRAYNYNTVDGTSYIIVSSSNSIFYSIGDGNFTAITSTRTRTAVDSFTTAKGRLYFDNGVDGLGGYWDGATFTSVGVSISTGMVSGKYIIYWHNRLFKAGVTGTPSVVYYSEVNNPEHIGVYNYLNVNINDGDQIKAMFAFGDRLYIAKERSFWEIVETNAGVFQLRMISNTIGCLYDTTVQEVPRLGAVCFMSSRGIEAFNGAQFTLLSEPIDNYVRGLNQINAGSGSWQQTTSDDFANGASFVGVDTVTYQGSVSQYIYPPQLDSSGIGTARVDYYGNMARQKIVTDRNMALDSVTVMSYQVDNQVFSILIQIKADDGTTTIASSTQSVTTKATPGIYIDTFTVNAQLNANTTYYIQFSSYTGMTGGSAFYFQGSSFVDEVNAERYIQSNPELGWISTGYQDLYYRLNIASSSYVSQYYMADNWGTWGQISIDDTEPAGSSISYYAITSTSVYNLSTNTPFEVTSNLPINSDVGPYIQIVASFTRTDYLCVPKLNAFVVNWYGITSDVPYAFVWRDKYGVSVSTDATSSNNDSTLWFQKDNSWTIHSGAISSGIMYRGNLYTSDYSGYFHSQFVPEIYTRDGETYPSYWTSKMMDFNTPINEKHYSNIWIRAQNIGDNDLDIQYRLDGTTGWNTQSLNMTNSWGGDVIDSVTLPIGTKGYLIQYRFGSNYDFRIKRIDTEYEIKSRR